MSILRRLTNWIRPLEKTSYRRNAHNLRRLVVEVLEDRVVPTHLGGDLAILPDGIIDPAFTGVQSQPPGEDTGPTPAGFPTFATLANGMPILNSLPAAPTTIYIDFDGDTSGSNPRGDPTVSPYSEDADGTTFNVTEQRSIFECWREVSSYFAVFNINVTTVQPAASMPTAWLAVGNNISGGYSYVRVFPNSVPLSWNESSDARTRVSGVTHELGHNFGLWHQSTYDQWGVKTDEYANATDALHGPIMGIDYSGVVHKFFIGHDSTAVGVTTLQDDIAIIAAEIAENSPPGSDGFRADDFGNTIAAATALPTFGDAQWTSAIIERMGDVDAFSFTSAGGVYALSAAPDAPSGVDLKLDVYALDGTLLATSDNANNVQELTMTLGSGTYFALVSSHGNYGDVGRYFMSVSPLPAGWASVDVGTGTSGYTVYDASTGTFNVVGSGRGIGNTGAPFFFSTNTDGFQYAYQPLNGDGAIIARVVNVDNTSNSAKVGVTIRETLAANSQEVSMVLNYSGTAQLLRRSVTGGTTSAITGTSGAWLKLERVGSSFTGSTSTDGTTWTPAGTVTVAMDANVTIGLLTTSANAHALNVGVLDNVSISGDVSTPTAAYNSLAAPTGLTVAPGTGTGLDLTWDAVVGAAGYAIDRSSDGVTFVQIATPGSTSYSDPNLPGSLRYFYRVSATDIDGRSVPSDAVSGVNRPSAVTNIRLISPSINQLVVDWRETTGEAGYRIERSTDGVTFTPIATVAANVPSYTDSGLPSNVAYYYQVIPTSTLGDGPASAIVSGAARLAAVNPTLGAVVVGSITINWTDIADETGYRVERSTNGTTFSTLTTLSAGAITYTDNTVASAVEYYYRVYGTTDLTQSVDGEVPFAAGPSATPPSAPWSSQDIGVVAGPGTTDLTGSTFKIISSGIDVTGTSDALRFTSQPLISDGEVIARVATIENTGSDAKVGVMMRQSTAANSANVLLYVTPTLIGFQYRDATGTTTTTVTTLAGTTPRWLRLVRSGLTTFTGSYSSDGATWTTLSAVGISMTGTVAAGLAAVSNSTTLLNTSTLDNVSVTLAKSLSINDPTIVEGNAGTSTAIFTVTLISPSTQTITVGYATSDNTATAGSDYVATSGTLTFNPGETIKTFGVGIKGDTLVEPNETFFVNLSGATNASIADAQGICTIVDDDGPISPTISATADSDAIRIVRNGAILEIHFNGVLVETFNYSTVQTLTINGLAGADVLTVDHAGGNPIPIGGVTYNGGGDAGDALSISGGAFNTDTYNYNSAMDGNLQLDADGPAGTAPSVINYTGLASISNTGTAVLAVVNLTAGADSIALVDLGGGMIRALPENATVVPTDFTAPTGSLTVNGLAGPDAFRLPTAPLGVPVHVNGGAGPDTLIGNNANNTWNVTALNAGSITGLVASFATIETLLAGGGRDVFRFGASGSVSGAIRNGAGSDWLDYSAVNTSVVVNLATGVASRVVGGVQGFNNVIGSANGGDKLTGTANGGVLLGHGKGNTLTAGAGRSVLIGGYGVNSLVGGAADDLLINGRTTYDANYASLEAILGTWQNAGRSYTQRIADLQAAGSNRLKIGVTVFIHSGQYAGGIGLRVGRGNFAYQSTLAGNAGADWFITRLLLTAFDRKAGEVVTMT